MDHSIAIDDAEDEEAPMPDEFGLGPSPSFCENRGPSDITGSHAPSSPRPANRSPALPSYSGGRRPEFNKHVRYEPPELPHLRVADKFENSWASQKAAALSLLSLSPDKPEGQDRGVSRLSAPLVPRQSPLDRDPTCRTPMPSPKSTPFKLPTSPASTRRSSAERTKEGVEASGRKVQREGTPFPGEVAEKARTIPDQRPEKPAEDSNSPSPTPSQSPPQSPESSDSSDDSSSLLAFSSPSDTTEARRNRHRMPLFWNLEGHGITTYGRVPEDRSIEVEDVTVGRGVKDDDSYRVCEGSTNGHYLQDRISLQMLAKEIAESKHGEYPLTDLVIENLRVIKSRKNSWADTIAKLQITSFGNTSEWMKEMWGPPVKDERGRIMQLRRQSPQSVGYKRLSVSPPEGQRSTKKLRLLKMKPLKKQHRRFTSPANSEIPCVTPGSPMNLDQQQLDRLASASRKKRLVLLPPKPEQPGGRICSRCGHLGEDGGMFACFKCGRCTYCSASCQEKRKDDFCTQFCTLENWSKAYSESLSGSSRSPAPDKDPEDRRGISGAADALNDQIGGAYEDTDDVMDMSAVGLEEQKKAMKEWEQKAFNREQQRCHQDSEDDWSVVDYNFTEKWRSLEYLLRHDTSGKEAWAKGINLLGRRWTEKMQGFWYNNEETAGIRCYLEHPDGGDEIEPGPFGRFILKAEFPSEREIVLDVRDFERHRPNNDSDEAHWLLASDLGPEWDSALDAY